VSVIERIRDRLDAPRFCPDDGQPIKVRNIPRFDGTTGESKDRFFWMCPEVYLSVGEGRLHWEQTGYHVHVHGTGRPRWHRLADAPVAR
jgi:hypothetical protein